MEASVAFVHGRPVRRCSLKASVQHARVRRRQQNMIMGRRELGFEEVTFPKPLDNTPYMLAFGYWGHEVRIGCRDNGNVLQPDCRQQSAAAAQTGILAVYGNDIADHYISALIGHA